MNFSWYNAREFNVEGKGWEDTDPFYGRLPVKAKGKVRDIIWELGQCSAGITIRFQTDAPEIRVRWKLRNELLSKPSSPVRACSGLDLYARTPEGKWRWVGTSKEIESRNPENMILAGVPEGMHEFMIYLPLFNPVEEMEIGVPAESAIEAVATERRKPIVYYGTSIVHGAGVTRPGMAHASVLGRRLDDPVLNIGFDGNALMEPEIAELLTELDPALFILDAVPNMPAELIKERAESFIHIIRKAHADTPIMLVEDRSYPQGWLLPGARYQNTSRRSECRKVYEKLIFSGMEKIYYLEGEQLLGEDGDGTADGSHPSDLGAVRMADILEPPVRKILNHTNVKIEANTRIRRKI